MEKDTLKSIIESLLFVSGEPIKTSKIAKIAGAEKEAVAEAVKELAQEYAEHKRGMVLLQKGEEIQLATNPDNISFVEQLVKNELADSLSPAALEVVSIIAYRGPITKTEIEMIRGVNCSYTLRNLGLRGLIERSDNPRDSRGYVYSISFDFLKKLGIEGVEKLPEYDTMSKDGRISSIISE
jgi:segregation and condensation protein B